MAARSKGRVLERNWKNGRGYALRFWAYGEREYLTLGSERDGWTYKRAEEELENILADVRRGIWVSPKKKKPRAEAEDEADDGSATTIFGPFGRQLVASRKGQVSENHHSFLKWGLGHLLLYFGDWPLVDIDVQAVDAYRHHKVQEGEKRQRAIDRRKPLRDDRDQILRPLSATSINHTIDTLQWVLSVALEYKLIPENPAAGKRRRLKEAHKPPIHLDTAEQIEALIDAAEELDRDLRFTLTDRKAVVATLVFSGPRALEVGYMRWRDVDLASGRLFIGRSKTQAGLREIKMLPILRDVLAAHKASAYRCGPDDLVFPTATGGRRDKDNIRERVLAKVVERANELLGERGRVPLPKGLTPHKLRHTFASVLIACGEDPISVMKQLGHSDPAFTLRVYSHMMSREPGERSRLKALVNGDRVAAVTYPPEPPRLLDCAAYELPILRALAERDGLARRREIRAAVLDAVESRLSDLDREILPSGEPRWEARFDKARSKLMRAGCLKPDSPRGVWELAAPGLKRLGATERRRLRAVAAQGSGADREREAIAA
ncbi:MAG TPA: tyrosine-type recombinase/integrase [Solirubrobacterales bacterium]|jgi:integrase|nr:tyrosine-type recombinase/integrase [Solirubrobacterales bacterium]